MKSGHNLGSRYLEMMIENANAMGHTEYAKTLQAEQTAYTAQQKKIDDSIGLKLRIAGLAIIACIVAPLGLALSNVELTKQYAPDGRQIVHLENYVGTNIDPCNSTVFAVYKNGKPIQCPTPQ